MYHRTLFDWTLLHFAPCMDMHGFALVYIYIYIYTYIHPYIILVLGPGHQGRLLGPMGDHPPL